MKTEANSTSGAVLGWVLTANIAALLIMCLVKIGLIWFT